MSILVEAVSQAPFAASMISGWHEFMLHIRHRVCCLSCYCELSGSCTVLHVEKPPLPVSKAAIALEKRITLHTYSALAFSSAAN